MYLQSLPALTLFGTQRVLRAGGTRLAPTEPEGETVGSNPVASIEKKDAVWYLLFY